MLFTMHMNDLQLQLNRSRIGCHWPIDNTSFNNNITYADDMVIISPSVKGLNAMLRICHT